MKTRGVEVPVQSGTMWHHDHIPEAIVEDIFSRLPVKSLLRFKTASKPWFSLISDPQFVRLHSRRVSQNPKILLSTGSQFKFLDYQTAMSFNDSSALVDLHFPEETPPESNLKIIGSSLGLVCVATQCGRFFIWNPYTGTCKRILNMSCRVNKRTHYLHGFGYDFHSDDFKIVRTRNDRTSMFNVFSLKKNSWKRIRLPFEFSLTFHVRYHALGTPATLSNGALHWFLFVNHIIAFDLAKEKFQKLPMPKNVDWEPRYLTISLLEHKGFLCLSAIMANMSLEIWMMKKYGVETSWTNFLKLPGLNVCKLYTINTVCISWSSEFVIVVRAGNQFVRFSSKDENHGKSEIFVGPSVWGAAALCVDTLISPNDFNGDDRLIDGEMPRKRKERMS